VQDRPSADELLDAVAGYLFAELRPSVPREERFRLLVAANVCAVIARELRAGREPTLADLALFREAAGSAATGPEPLQTDAEVEAEARRAAVELAALIRAGGLDDRLGETVTVLREHVRRKLEVARPGYDE
jgi:Domain of unknown function (DUF6285)